MNIRKNSFAGSWYPADNQGCEQEIKGFIKHQDLTPYKDKNLNGGIVPHAGWFFSGGLAARVFNALAASGIPDTVIIFGMHLHHHSPMYITSGCGFETPIGSLETDEVLAEEMMGQFDFKVDNHINYQTDNTIELQLPFIKYFFPNAKILTMGIPPSNEAVRVGQAAANAAKKHNRSVFVIGSTDLTHYGPNYGYTPFGTGPDAASRVKETFDTKIIETMVSFDINELLHQATENQSACCPGAIVSVISSAKQLGSNQGEMLQYRTSSDKQVSSSFVGYTGIVF